MKVKWDGQVVAEFVGENPVSWTPAFKRIYKEFQERGLPVMFPPNPKDVPKGAIVDCVEYRKELGILLNAMLNAGYQIEYEKGE